MTEKLRIALVTAFPPGQQSLNEYGYHLARKFIARDDVEKVIVLADKVDGPVQELNMGDKLEVRRIWRFNSVFAGISILRHLRQAKVDGVIFNLQTASFGDRELPAALGLMVPMVARWLGTPSGIVAHNIIAGIDLDNTILKGQRIRQAVVRLGGACVSRAMCAASYITVTLPSYAAILGAQSPRADLHHVPHGTFDADVKDVLPLAQRPERIVTMGKFGTYKRLETMLDAFALFRKDQRFSDYELVIGGMDHPNTPGYVATLAKQWADDSQVRFHGYVSEPDVPAFFGNARLSLFDYTSTTGSSGILHQTASFGTVPVFPNIGDFVDVGETEGLHGLNFEPGSVDSMVKAMQSGLHDLANSESIAQSNLVAAGHMPLSKVVEFHVEKIRQLATPKGNSDPVKFSQQLN